MDGVAYGYQTPEHHSAEWHELRATGVGGSDIAAICGYNPWRGAFDVYLDKTGQKAKDEPNFRMRRGTFFEDAIAELYQHDTGFGVHKVGRTLTHPDHACCIANIDRLVMDFEGDVYIGEIKTVGIRSAYKWGEPGQQVVPVDYYFQALWYAHILSLNLERDGHPPVKGFRLIADIEGDFDGLRDEVFPYDDAARATAERLVEQAVAFWNNNVLAKDPPGVDATRASDDWLAKSYPRPTKEQVEGGAEADEILEELAVLKPKLKEEDQKVKALENRLKALCGEAELMNTSHGTVKWGLVTGRVSNKKLIGKLVALIPEDKRPSQEAIAEMEDECRGKPFRTLRHPYSKS